MEPKIQKAPKPFNLKECGNCEVAQGPDQFIKTRSPFYKDGYIPICNSCIRTYLRDKDFAWDAVDRLCQYIDIPFVPSEFERLHDMNGDDVLPKYAEVFQASEYQGLGWDDYFKEFLKLKAEKQIENELPLIKEERVRELKERWGPNYDPEALQYLEQLYQGLLSSQNINSPLQADQAMKICKTSYEIDCKIREGSDYDKLLSSYDKLIKAAEFTPKNAKNISEFESIGECLRWLELRGYVCKYYDDITRDIVDETIKNMQSYNRRLYTNESGIGEEITRRIEALERMDRMERVGTYTEEDENIYGNKDYGDLTEFENEGYNELIKQDFEAEVEGYDG